MTDFRHEERGHNETFRLPDRGKVRTVLEDAGLTKKFDPFVKQPSEEHLLQVVRTELESHTDRVPNTDPPPEYRVQTPLADLLPGSALEILTRKHLSK